MKDNEEVLQLSLKDFTDIIFDPTNPVDYASMAGGPLGKGIMAVGKIPTLLQKLEKIRQAQAKAKNDLLRGRANIKVGIESGYDADINGGEKLIMRGNKRLDTLKTQEENLLKKLPIGHMEMDLNRGGLVRTPMMNLKY